MGLSEKLEAIIKPVVESFGCVLWGVEFRPLQKSALLRIFIDKQGGVSLDDCSNVSYQLSGVLDVEDPIQMPYTLEVSSPGIDRPLLKPEHFTEYRGATIKVRLQWPIEGSRNFQGILESSNDEQIELAQDGRVIQIPYAAITKARLKLDVDFSNKGSLQ